jgi:hypothetical protein
LCRCFANEFGFSPKVLRSAASQATLPHASRVALSHSRAR